MGYKVEAKGRPDQEFRLKEDALKHAAKLLGHLGWRPRMRDVPSVTITVCEVKEPEPKPELIQVEYVEGGCRYTYRADGLGVKVGDLVYIPGSWVSSGRRQLVKVVELGSDYTGEVKSVESLAWRASTNG